MRKRIAIIEVFGDTDEMTRSLQMQIETWAIRLGIAKNTLDLFAQYNVACIVDNGHGLTVIVEFFLEPRPKRAPRKRRAPSGAASAPG